MAAPRDPELVRRAIEEARTLFDDVGEFESGALIRSERDSLEARDSAEEGADRPE
jgi:hypothetical protein